MSGSGKTKKRTLLTAKAIEALKPDPAGAYRVPDARAAGLALRVATDGGKTWDLAFRIKGGGFRRLSLGRYVDVTLEAARTRADKLTSAARQGVDLIAQERQARDDKAKALKLGALVDLYLDRRVRRRLRSAREIELTLKRVLGPLAATPAADIRKCDLSPILEAIAATGHERAAGKARRLVGTLFKWAESLDLVPDDPTRGLPAYDLGSPRDRVFDEGELRLFWFWLEDSTLSDAMADALRVQLLVGARVGEIAGMATAEVDRGAWLWTLPAARSKNKRARTTPLVGLARTIISARIEAAAGGPLFPSETGAALTSAALATALFNRRAQLPIASFGTHDLRRTVATGLEELGVAENVIGAIVGHGREPAERAARTLKRHYLKSPLTERKTSALEAWDARLRAIISGELASNVVPIRQGV